MSSSAPEGLDRLLALEDIKLLRAKYCRRIDSHRFSELADIFPFATNINLKAVDHIDGRPAIRQLTSRSLADVKVSECWRGPSTVELRPNAQAPVHRLPVREMLDSYYWSASFTLVPGVILLDYLEEENR